jgi:YggT family protein
MVGLVIQILHILSLIVIADALLSWVSPNPDVPPRSITGMIATPLSAPVRAILSPKMTGGVDLSPIVVILILNGIQKALIEASGGGL